MFKDIIEKIEESTKKLDSEKVENVREDYLEYIPERYKKKESSDFDSLIEEINNL